jgi:tellurite resistance protein TehA-like permease
MGTGIVSILLHQLPYQFPGLEKISIVIWMVNVVLFLVLFVGSCARYILYPDVFVKVLKHPVQSCYYYLRVRGGLMVGERCRWDCRR